ncbi:isochorismate synthase [Xanthomonas sp. XNM01]|uniref:isochorismate synthase n=1 Tax=Xanthomonas sp. XNM01 TaxID=2769289 RepID=UPI001CE04AE4|nr:isochorismate synthase [Xanthomonas sp. XNM01]
MSNSEQMTGPSGPQTDTAAREGDGRVAGAAPEAPARTVASAAARQAAFVLQDAGTALVAEGCRQALPRGTADTLAARVRAFFAAAPTGPALLVGALPFAREHPDCLYQPDRVRHVQAAAGLPLRVPSGAAPAIARTALVPEPAADAYHAAVARSTALMRAEHGRADALRKVVLSRSLRVVADAAADPWQLARRLAADSSVTTYLAVLPGTGDVPDALVGATPELLVSRRGRRVHSHPLAGSARRHRDPVRDRDAAEALLVSRKDHDEHRMVVEAILDALAPLCTQLQAPPRPSLHSTASMWHLGTRIEGELRDADVDAAALAALLHPTPAICGQPPERARALIAELEPYDRGFYAGALGWTDAAGDGDWYVAIRCAQWHGADLRLYAGAGIVAESDPALETEETSAKFAALLDALGLGEPASPTQEPSP